MMLRKLVFALVSSSAVIAQMPGGLDILDYVKDAERLDSETNTTVIGLFKSKSADGMTRRTMPAFALDESTPQSDSHLSILNVDLIPRPSSVAGSSSASVAELAPKG